MADILESFGRADIGGQAIRLKESLERSRANKLSAEVTGINLQQAKNTLAAQETEKTRRATSVNLLTTPMYLAMSPGGQERVKTDMLSRGLIDTEGIGTIGGGEDYLKSQVESVEGYKAIMGGEVAYKKQQYLQSDTEVRAMEKEAQEKGKDLKTDKKYGIAIKNRDRLQDVYTKSQAAYGGHLLDLDKTRVTAEEARKTAAAKAKVDGKGITFTKLEGAAFKKWLDGDKLSAREQSIVDKKMDNDNALFAAATRIVMDDFKIKLKGRTAVQNAITETFEAMKSTRDATKTTNVADRFEKDKTVIPELEGSTLGEETPEGHEIIIDNKVIGYYN